jgi:hypothetical protein
VLLRDGEGRMCGAEIAFCQLPHILLICTGLWRGPSRLTGGSRYPRPSAACPRCSLCRAGTGWVGEAGDCGRWGGEGFVLTLGVLAVLLTAMHHDANIVHEHKEALDATGRRTGNRVAVGQRQDNGSSVAEDVSGWRCGAVRRQAHGFEFVENRGQGWAV